MVSAEVGRIHGDHANRTRDAEPDDAPVVSALGAAAAAGLPPVHPFSSIGVLALDEYRAPRCQEAVPGREELVRRDERPSAHADGGEIDQALVRHVHTLRGALGEAFNEPTFRFLASQIPLPYTRTLLARKSGAPRPRASYPRTA